MSIEETIDKNMHLVREALVAAAIADTKEAYGCGIGEDEMAEIVVSSAIRHILWSAELIPG